jgi:hypothetical protein
LTIGVVYNTLFFREKVMTNKKLVFLVIIAVILGMFCACEETGEPKPNIGPVNITDPDLSDMKTLAEKLAWVDVYGEENNTYIIEVNSDEFLDTQGLSYPGRNNITIQLIGISGIRNINLRYNTSFPLFGVGGGVTLILDEIILDGSNGPSPVVGLSGGNLIMNSGSKITNGHGGVHVDYGTFTMNGGEISGNENSGVHVDYGTFTMNGGTISGNTSTSYGGGGVYVQRGTFNMTGGEISGNTVYSSGGGVYVSGNGTFNMTGGTISGNTAYSTSGYDGGGGVYVYCGTFNMNGGEISGNTTAKIGGGVYVIGGTFNMTGGTISSNTANGGGGVFVGSVSSSLGISGTFIKTGGIITGFSSDNVNGNKAENPQNIGGHAVYATDYSHNASFSSSRHKETTSGQGDKLTFICGDPPIIEGDWE